MTQSRTLNQQKVVQAAAEIAKSDGLSQLTMSNLADYLGIRSQSLYHYVKNREDLISLVGAAILQRIRKQIVQQIVGLSGEKAILAMADRLRDELAKVPFMAGIFYSMRGTDGEVRIHDEVVNYLDLVNQIAQADGLEAMEVRPQMLVGAVFGFIFLDSFTLTDTRQTAEERQREYEEMIMRLITPRQTKSGH
ncbi:TetR/AcrR family transcriptional regulator [Limosilactobacillus difficilis]|uniref:TetR/AcrR family transcriptional regulator n=1 Tax=Limosilactobacillus difficilis TaxID=2991838 RepID=UPI0024B89139|nr:TetR/AcrR family transcriptional regulator [Limosilactobacillus difficilis]